MKELLENSELREIQILEFMYKSEEWFTVQDIANSLSYSVDTIYRSIAHINELALHYEIELAIISQKTKGMLLSVTSRAPLDVYQAVVITNSLSFKILDRIFQSTELSINRLATDYYVSKSTIYRKLRAIEEFFSYLGLIFNSSTFDITGSEVILRKFYFKMYCSVSATGNWPFRDISKQVLEYRIMEGYSTLSEAQTQRILFLLAVNFVRHKKKCYIIDFPQAEYIDPYRKATFSFVKKFYEDNIPKNMSIMNKIS